MWFKGQSLENSIPASSMFGFCRGVIGEFLLYCYFELKFDDTSKTYEIKNVNIIKVSDL